MKSKDGKDDDVLQQLVERIARLEMMIGQATQEGTTLVSPLRVVDKKGKLIAEIQENQEKGSYSLKLFNPTGRLAVSLHGENSGGSLAIRDNTGFLAFYVTNENDGGKLLVNNVSGGGISVYNDGEGCGINLINAEGHHGIEMSSGADGGEIKIFSKDESVEAILDTSET